MFCPGSSLPGARSASAVRVTPDSDSDTWENSSDDEDGQEQDEEDKEEVGKDDENGLDGDKGDEALDGPGRDLILDERLFDPNTNRDSILEDIEEVLPQLRHSHPQTQACVDKDGIEAAQRSQLYREACIEV
jgi:hypothetical protein